MDVMTDEEKLSENVDFVLGKIPEHLLIDIFVRVPISEWSDIACVKKQWASLLREESLWQAALIKAWPSACCKKRWPGPIPQGSSRRRYMALYISKHILGFDGDIDELAGHVYLFLKEQLELSTAPPTIAILRGTMIDQFIACGETRAKAYELVSHIWIAVVNNLEENERTFLFLKYLAQEGDVFLPYPWSHGVEWRIFEKLFTDFRNCFSSNDYYDVLVCAKLKFQTLPSTWLGY